MEKNIVSIFENKLYLSSGLNGQSFARANLAPMIDEKGLNFSCQENGGDFIISQSDFNFDSTEEASLADENDILSDKKGILSEKKVYFIKNSVDGRSLLDLITEKKAGVFSNEEIFVLKAFSKIIRKITGQGEESQNPPGLQALGAGGIIYKADYPQKKVDFIFLPPQLFDACAQNHQQLYPQIEGKWLYKGLDFKSGWLYMRAVSFYLALRGAFPFEENDISRRQEDIYDENFLPLCQGLEDKEKSALFSIDSALRLKIAEKITVGKRIITDIKSQAKIQKKIRSAENFNEENFCQLLSQEKSGQLHYDSKKILRFKKNQKVKIQGKRFLRRNKNRILVILAVIFMGSWWLSGFLKENAKLISSLSLTSSQTTAALYKTIHDCSASNLQEIIKGRDTKDLMLKISGYFVSQRQRLEVSPDNKTVKPEEWFFYKKNSVNWMFGITNLRIDGVKYPVNGVFPVKKDRVLPLKEENGVTLKKGDEVTHQAQYYLISQSESRIQIEKIDDLVKLRWNGKKWQVVKVDGKKKVNFVKVKDFINEYYTAKDKYDGEKTENQSPIRLAVQELSQKYSWLPDENDLKSGAKKLDESFGSVEAELFLK